MTTSLAQNLKPILMLKHDKSVINVPQISLIVKLGAELQGYPFHVRAVVPPFLLVVFSYPMLTRQNFHIPSIQSQSDLLLLPAAARVAASGRYRFAFELLTWKFDKWQRTVEKLGAAILEDLDPSSQIRTDTGRQNRLSSHL